MQLIEDQNLVIKYQFRFPRSKRKRIVKKWSKQELNFKFRPDMYYYKTGSGFIIGHPEAISILKQKLRGSFSQSSEYGTYGTTPPFAIR